ncbi:probable peptide chain release factor C12orf65, mitochondrial isoform X2 [Sitophilus oryzae]|uniref:Probable peptide chain release factor C12orf65, mitochondrial isoform X2 n=1 Tax=Sitophilus oryzae TaxID=7048 RepID=A0A6J2Y8A5_SITOR|nr:probable peptide chain release factor C12orf65, mitochondrial isoform X2 [Sitophilus oryzae]
MMNLRQYSNFKKHIDHSKVPVLNDNDLEEQHVRGSGPGGSKISTTSSCVVLKHVPTGLVVKCQETRFLEQNRKKARQLLVSKLDNLLNGNNSIDAQIKRYTEKKRTSYECKKEKLRQLKDAWKERENIS